MQKLNEKSDESTKQ